MSPKPSNLAWTTWRFTRQIAGLLLVWAACPGRASALGHLTPELDPGSSLSALTLLVGGLFLLAHRSRSH